MTRIYIVNKRNDGVDIASVEAKKSAHVKVNYLVYLESQNTPSVLFGDRFEIDTYYKDSEVFTDKQEAIRDAFRYLTKQAAKALKLFNNINNQIKGIAALDTGDDEG